MCVFVCTYMCIYNVCGCVHGCDMYLCVYTYVYVIYIWCVVQRTLSAAIATFHTLSPIKPHTPNTNRPRRPPGHRGLALAALHRLHSREVRAPPQDQDGAGGHCAQVGGWVPVKIVFGALLGPSMAATARVGVHQQPPSNYIYTHL